MARILEQLHVWRQDGVGLALISVWEESVHELGTVKGYMRCSTRILVALGSCPFLTHAASAGMLAPWLGYSCPIAPFCAFAKPAAPLDQGACVWHESMGQWYVARRECEDSNWFGCLTLVLWGIRTEFTVLWRKFPFFLTDFFLFVRQKRTNTKKNCKSDLTNWFPNWLGASETQIKLQNSLTEKRVPCTRTKEFLAYNKEAQQHYISHQSHALRIQRKGLCQVPVPSSERRQTPRRLPG